MSGQALPLSGFVGGQVPKPPPAPPVPVAPAAPPEPALVLLDAPAEPEVDALLVALEPPRPALPAEPPVESSPPQCIAPTAKKQKKMAKMGFFMGTPYFSSQTAREA
jgi:hypothetical protein